jgi:peroxiredoxin
MHMALQVGDTAPEFELSNQFGETVSLGGLLAKKPVVLVFFPLAFSGICTGELCELQENLNVFADTGIELVGISVDTKFSLKAWATQEGYDFPLLSDFWPHGDVAKKFGVFVEETGFANRATFVIGQDGVIRSAIITAPGQARDFAEYREAIGALSA